MSNAIGQGIAEGVGSLSGSIGKGLVVKQPDNPFTLNEAGEKIANKPSLQLFTPEQAEVERALDLYGRKQSLGSGGIDALLKLAQIEYYKARAKKAERGGSGGGGGFDPFGD